MTVQKYGCLIAAPGNYACHCSFCISLAEYVTARAATAGRRGVLAEVYLMLTLCFTCQPCRLIAASRAKPLLMRPIVSKKRQLIGAHFLSLPMLLDAHFLECLLSCDVDVIGLG